MAWQCFWHLERKDEDGGWQLISSGDQERESIFVWDLNPNGNHDGMTAEERQELQDNIQFAMQQIATSGLPRDASEATLREFQFFVEHGGYPPHAGHVLLQNVIDHEQHGKLWKNLSHGIPATWKNWIDRMKAMGPLKELRYVFIWAR